MTVLSLPSAPRLGEFDSHGHSFRKVSPGSARPSDGILTACSWDQVIGSLTGFATRSQSVADMMMESVRLPALKATVG